MPNEKVKYFKPIEEIKDRIVYVKDKDVIGFDTASIYEFHLYLWNMTQFNLSDNFIYMDDDYFIGKPIKKSDFFYYDEEQKKVLPNIVSDQYKELNRGFIDKQYNKLFSKKDKINPHTSDGWLLHTCAGFKLLLENFPEPLVDAGFTHNALSLNTHYIKEIYDLVKAKYQYANELLYSKERTVYDIQFQTIYNAYALNVKKGKVHIIPRKFFDLLDMKKKIDLDVELFVINTSGENKYNNLDFHLLQKKLEAKFSNPTPYEIVAYKATTKEVFNKPNEKTEKKEKIRKSSFILFLLIILIIILFIIIIFIVLKLFFKVNICSKSSRYSLIRRHKRKRKIYISEESYKLTGTSYL